MNTRWKIAQAAEIRWWRNYLGKKEPAEYLAWKRAYWHDFLDKIGHRPAAGARVLDVGCGPAGVFTVLSEQRVDAVDPLLDSYERDLPHFSASRYPRVDFYARPFEQYALTTQYDTVFCLNAVNHVADLAACCDKLTAALAPGGTLVMSIDAHNFALLKSLFRLLPGDILHPHQYDLAEYRKMLTDRDLIITGCELIKHETIFDYYCLTAKKAAR